MTLPADAIPVIDWPEYAITPSGEVWRVAPSVADGWMGPPPRMLNPLGMGPGGRHPSVKMARFGFISTRTIRSLVRQHFGE